MIMELKLSFIQKLLGFFGLMRIKDSDAFSSEMSTLAGETLSQNKHFLDEAKKLSEELVAVEVKLKMAQVNLEFYRTKCELHFDKLDLMNELSEHYDKCLKKRSEMVS